MFEPPQKLLLGLLTGLLFGFLLQKGRVAKYHVILGQFLLKDWTVVKIMGTAVLVGAVGYQALVQSGLATPHVKPFLLVGVLLGGVLFGLGMATLGYCPGTSIAACGEGHRDAYFGALGMLAGASVFVALYPIFDPLRKQLGDLGEITAPAMLGVSPWLIIGGLWLLGLAAVGLHERRRPESALRPASEPVAEELHSTTI